ncbi:MAG: hypothetical protein GC168_07655 [Candidatus Hydrogenedens sp.]|nr:hypothetical protein [Candidatus Hydrogenedens sp.]
MKFIRHRQRKVTANVEMTPLIDVVFQLLIFFMLSSTFVVQSSIPIQDPISENAGAMEAKDVTVTIQNNTGGPGGLGSIYIDDVEIQEMEELVATLAELHRENPEAMVLIRADANVTTQRLIQVLEQVTASGIEKYGIGAISPSGSS